MSKEKDFNDFRFKDLNYRSASNKYYTMNRVSEDETKIVVKVADCHLLKTRYGYALILDRTRVVFLKDWQVDCNWFGNEVILQKEYFNIKEWGNHEEFFPSEELTSFEQWLQIAKEQDDLKDEDGFKKNPVKWEK